MTYLNGWNPSEVQFTEGIQKSAYSVSLWVLNLDSSIIGFANCFKEVIGEEQRGGNSAIKRVKEWSREQAA